METRISSALLRRVIAIAAASPDREVCGLLLGRPDRIAAIAPADNVHAEPWHRFELDPAAHFAALRAARAGGLAVIGHFHSHPGGRAEPSATDAAMALETGQMWLIVAGNTARLWLMSHSGTFKEIAMRIDDPDGCAGLADSPQEPRLPERA